MRFLYPKCRHNRLTAPHAGGGYNANLIIVMSSAKLTRKIHETLVLCALTLISSVAVASDVHEAAKKGNVEVLQQLLAKGELVDQKDQAGWTPLCYAAYAGHSNIVHLLIKERANINATTEQGFTPLAAAVSGRQVGTFSLLLDAGADWKVTEGPYGASLLHIAADQGHNELAQRLISLGLKVDTKTSAGDGVTPLHTAAVRGHSDLLKLLLEKGATVDLPDNSGRTALHWAAIYGRDGCVTSLIQAKAAVNAKDKKQRSPLHYAAEEDISNPLAGRNPRSVTFELFTISKSYRRIVDMLLNAGADPNAKDAKGKTPLHAAIEGPSDDKAIIRLLLAQGADPNVKDNDGKSLLDAAKAEGKKESVGILENPSRKQ